MKKQFKSKLGESLSSVLPITAIVFLLSFTIAPLSAGVTVLFIFGAIMLSVGMGLFTLGADMSMIPMGEGIGVQMSKSKKIFFSLLLCFVLGVIITIAEPDLQVLADKFPSIDTLVLIVSVAVGVGIFLVIAMLRILFKIRLSILLIVFYLLVFGLVIFTPGDFISVAFDSGGVTTGPMTVPFIMALGIGMASVRSDKNSSSDSFGLVALCSIGPILSVLILGFFYDPSSHTEPFVISEIDSTREAITLFIKAIPHYAQEVFLALSPLVVVFIIFELATRRFHKHQVFKMIIGFLYAYIGLVLFLTGANVGFMPTGQLIGKELALMDNSFLLVPIGFILGYFIVAAEPAVHVLKKQVEEISNGMISQRSIGLGLSIGVGISVGIAMLRILTGLPILYFLIPGYFLSLFISFFVPPIYTGIAFDSGGVASGTMTATFLLPLAMGACEAVGGNLLTDAFGIVALIAMTPLITIQILGLRSELKRKVKHKMLVEKLAKLDDHIIYLDKKEGNA